MPYGMPNVIDLLKLEAGVGHEIIEESLMLSPEFEEIPADTIEGDVMTLTVRTDLPSIAFRNANEGTPRSKSRYETRTFQTGILDHQAAVDRALADKRKPEARARLLRNHMAGVVEAAARHSSSQFYYGIGHDKKGFPGLIAQHTADADHEVDATGTSSKSSVWFLRVGPETVEFLFGNDRTLAMEPDWKIETVYDENNNPYQAYANWLTGNVGLRLANKHAAVRIKNIGTAAGKTLTPDHMHEALRKFTDLGWEPNLILMNGRSLEQLRKSYVTDLNVNPPTPKEFESIKIRRTSHILSSETI